MSGYVTPGVPNVTDYTTFLRNELDIPVSALPDNSSWITWALNRGVALIQNFPGYVDQYDYTNVVYNCAAHIQIEITPDQPAQSFFSTLRGGGEGGFNLVGSVTGILSAASDQGTSQSMVVPDAMQRLTFQDLQFAKTPWGRVALGWGQDIGPVWGVT